MKILQINTVYGTGSTGKIVVSIETVASENGHDMYVAYGRGDILSDCHYYRVGNRLDFWGHVLINFFKGASGFGSIQVTKKFIDWIDKIGPDVIHIHNLHGFYVHIGILMDYIKTKNIPVIMTLHDCWAFTGQCAHFDYVGCEKWISGCYECPIHRSDYPYSLFKDNSRDNYYNKKNAFQGIENIRIVVPSRWLASKVEQSYLGIYPVTVINNGINKDIFCINSKTLDDRDRELSAKKIVLAVANVWDKRKGIDYILRLVNELGSNDGYMFVIIGLSKSQKKNIESKYKGKNIVALSRTKTQEELVDWYNKATVFINPSLQENFPTTNIEAQACGTPVITFNSGGAPETVNSNSGIIIERGNYDMLKNAVIDICKDDKRIISCVDNAKQYDEKECFARYLDIYGEIVETCNDCNY